MPAFACFFFYMTVPCILMHDPGTIALKSLKGPSNMIEGHINTAHSLQEVQVRESITILVNLCMGR